MLNTIKELKNNNIIVQCESIDEFELLIKTLDIINANLHEDEFVEVVNLYKVFHASLPIIYVLNEGRLINQDELNKRILKSNIIKASHFESIIKKSIAICDKLAAIKRKKESLVTANISNGKINTNEEPANTPEIHNGTVIYMENNSIMLKVGGNNKKYSALDSNNTLFSDLTFKFSKATVDQIEDFKRVLGRNGFVLKEVKRIVKDKKPAYNHIYFKLDGNAIKRCIKNHGDDLSNTKCFSSRDELLMYYGLKEHSKE